MTRLSTLENLLFAHACGELTNKALKYKLDMLGCKVDLRISNTSNSYTLYDVAADEWFDIEV